MIAALAALGMVVLCLGALSLSIERLQRQEKQQTRRQRLPCLWEGFDEQRDDDGRVHCRGSKGNDGAIPREGENAEQPYHSQG